MLRTQQGRYILYVQSTFVQLQSYDFASTSGASQSASKSCASQLKCSADHSLLYGTYSTYQSGVKLLPQASTFSFTALCRLDDGTLSLPLSSTVSSTKHYSPSTVTTIAINMSSSSVRQPRGYTQDYIARIRYSNALPAPSMPPKLVDIPNPGLSQYLHPNFTARIVREQPINIEADAELGMPLDLVGLPGIFDGDESGMNPRLVDALCSCVLDS